jgi:glutamate racemase
MIGLFDTGHGGLTVYTALRARFPAQDFIYFGDHRNAPYGNLPSADILRLTQGAMEFLFRAGCPLALLVCNTATAVAGRYLQQQWLPQSPYRDRRILGIIVPTVEAVTQTPWSAVTPQYPQKYNRDRVAIFGTPRTIESGVFKTEIHKRCPLMDVTSQAIPLLAGAIEAGESEARLETLVREGIEAWLLQTGGLPAQQAVLGCTHYPLVEHLFRRHLPPATRILSQPEAVANSLEDYLSRHPEFVSAGSGRTRFYTSGDPLRVGEGARRFLGRDLTFEKAA